MGGKPNKKDKLLLKAAVITAVSVVVLREAPPMWVAGHDAMEITAFGGLILGAPPLMARTLMILANAIDMIESRLPDGSKNAARFVKSIRELKGRASVFKPAPYWGVIKGKPIFAAFQSNALILGPAGSSKDVSHAGPNLMALAGKVSKVVMDLKNDMSVIYGDALRAAGEDVICLNFGGKFPDRIDGTNYTPLSLIADNFTHYTITFVTADAKEMALQIYPEPEAQGGTDNSFFRKGSRKLISFAIIVIVLRKGATATLGDVLSLLQDTDDLLHHAQWVAGQLENEAGEPVIFPLHSSPWALNGSQASDDIDRFAEYLTKEGTAIARLIQAEDDRNFQSFLEGALGEMDDFNITTEAHKTTQAGTFRFRDLKEGDGIKTVFIGGDSSRPEAYKKIIEITTNNMFKELMRLEDSRKEIYVFGNELTNFRINHLEKYLTYLRSYRVKTFLYIQSLAAFRQTYGKDALQTLLSETEIKYILPGQRDPETLKMLSEELGEKKVIKRGNSGNRRDGSDGYTGLNGFSYSEDKAPLRKPDQIRRLEKGILFLGKNRPALIDTTSIASIWPFRHWQAISPFYDTAYRERIKLILWRFLPAAIRMAAKKKVDKS